MTQLKIHNISRRENEISFLVVEINIIMRAVLFNIEIYLTFPTEYLSRYKYFSQFSL